MIRGGGSDARLACDCLMRFGWPPSQTMRLSARERAFVCAALEEGGTV